MVVVVETSPIRRSPMHTRHGPGHSRIVALNLAKAHSMSTSKWDSLVNVADLIWAAAVGSSVTLRLWCSVRLSSSAGAPALAASCYVTTLALLISALFLVPFASLKSIPRRSGPWFGGMCTLPAFSLVAAANSLGLGLVQMVLRLGLLSTALSLDSITGIRGKELWRRFVGTGVVFIGVAVGILAGREVSNLFAPAYLTAFWVACTFISGSCYVFQARLMATPAQQAVQVDKQTDAATDALVCQLTNALVQVPLLVGFLLGGMPFYFHGKDLHLWLFTGFQGAWYLHSLQTLPSRLGYSTTFAVSLWGQLLTAVVLDIIGGNHAFSAGQSLGLGIVICGAVISATGGTGMKAVSPQKSSSDASDHAS
ncbi:unnamed protein product [Prorocentrum cordatum]|uniref:EamA domain-containing protein n=1 Tax=Prorocentrum cordatum TaxID=2364126 RepID=A0ABN9VSS2_9DINO|nr:unnamed protein product [Polarella glacialis]